MLIDPGNTYIGTLRATGRWTNPLALRMLLDHMLCAADLQPAGLPRHAIVCIRKLRDPCPQWWRTSANSIRPPRSWEQAMATALDQLVQRAAHPGRGTVPGNAEAVVFADYAELLACLASDWCAGEAASRWWWQSILQGQDVAHAVQSSWRQTPAYIPAAVQLLAGCGGAVTFARALSATDAYALVQNIIHRFALSKIQALLEAGDQTRRQGDDVAPQPSVHTSPPAPPWQSWVPEAMSPGLRFEQQCLLGLSLMLQRAAAVVRTGSFAFALRDWAQAAWQPEGYLAPHLSAGPVPNEQMSVKPTNLGPLSHELDQATEGVSGAAEPPRQSTYTPSSLVREGRHGGEAQLDAQPIEPPHHPGSGEGAQAPEGAAFPPGLAPMNQLGQLRPSAASAPERPFAEVIATTSAFASSRRPGAFDCPDLQIDTGLGGFFYLINVGLFLHLYGDFTTPAQPGIALSVWDFLTLLGQKLVGQQMHTDPVWELLAHLSGGGEQVAPGADFEPPDIWRLPVEWLAPFPEDEIWHWQAVDGRLRLRHPAQFLALDVPLQPVDPVLQLRSALREYGVEDAVELPAEPLPIDGGAAPLERWLGWLLPYVRARLQRALQVSGANELAQILCVHRARILVTATHVDILLALDTLPIEIRLAGLDRDPGWVPAAGRFIAFHFE